MSRSDWRIIAAVFGCLGVALFIGLYLKPKYPNLAGDGGYREQAAEYRAGGSKCEPSELDRLIGRKRDRQTDACQEAEEQHREATDSIIEARRSADAADASTIAAYEQARIAAFGFPVGVLTLMAAGFAAWYARDAARHTEAGAKTANEALLETRRIGEAQLTAYFSLLNLEYTLPQRDGVIPTFTLNIVNNGQTPAKDFWQFYKCFISEKNRPFVPLTAQEIGPTKVGNVGPGQAIPIIRRTIEATPKEIAAVLNGDEWLYIIGAIEFRNVYGRRRRVDFGRHTKGNFKEGSKPDVDGEMLFFTSNWEWQESEIEEPAENGQRA